MSLQLTFVFFLPKSEGDTELFSLVVWLMLFALDSRIILGEHEDTSEMFTQRPSGRTDLL